MALHAVAPIDVRYFSQDAERPVCPKCGDLLLAPEVSEFINDGRVRHRWACEACGNEFRTTVSFGRRA
jgi:RNase P subunit RPR2